MPSVVVPPPYRGPTGGLETLEVKQGSVRDGLEAVERRHPGFLAQVVDAAGQPHRFVKLFVNGDLLEGDVLGARLGEGDRLEIVAAIAGG